MQITTSTSSLSHRDLSTKCAIRLVKERETLSNTPIFVHCTIYETEPEPGKDPQNHHTEKKSPAAPRRARFACNVRYRKKKGRFALLTTTVSHLSTPSTFSWVPCLN